jgi:hypothetical protein
MIFIRLSNKKWTYTLTFIVGRQITRLLYKKIIKNNNLLFFRYLQNIFGNKNLNFLIFRKFFCWKINGNVVP